MNKFSGLAAKFENLKKTFQKKLFLSYNPSSSIICAYKEEMMKKPGNTLVQ